MFSKIDLAKYILNSPWGFSLLVFLLFLASRLKEVHATLLEEVEEALVRCNLLSGVQQRVLLLLSEGFRALMLLNVVHDLGDTVLVSLEQRAGYNWVQAADIGHDGVLVELKVLVHPPNGLEHAGIIGIFLCNPGHNLLVAVALFVIARQLHLLHNL